TVAPASVPADGKSLATITVIAKNLNGDPIPGLTATLSVSGGQNVVTQPATLTDSKGTTTGTVLSSFAEAKTVTATVDGVTLNQAPTVTFTPVNTAVAPSAAADVGATLINTPVSIAASGGLLANDAPGTPAASISSFGGGDLGGAVTDNGAGGTVAIAPGGSLNVNADGSVNF